MSLAGAAPRYLHTVVFEPVSVLGLAIGDPVQKCGVLSSDQLCTGRAGVWLPSCVPMAFVRKTDIAVSRRRRSVSVRNRMSTGAYVNPVASVACVYVPYEHWTLRKYAAA